SALIRRSSFSPRVSPSLPRPLPLSPSPFSVIRHPSSVDSRNRFTIGRVVGNMQVAVSLGTCGRSDFAMGDTYLSSGDMLVIITAVAAIAGSVWALMVGMALLFSKRSLMARASLEEAPWRAFFIGLPSAAAALILG